MDSIDITELMKNFLNKKIVKTKASFKEEGGGEDCPPVTREIITLILEDGSEIDIEYRIEYMYDCGPDIKKNGFYINDVKLEIPE